MTRDFRPRAVPGVSPGTRERRRVPFDDAETYMQAGWVCVLALPPGAKWPPPTGFTGADGRSPTPNDLATWRQEGRENLAVRLPYGVVGLDVDLYKILVQKNGKREIVSETEAEANPDMTPVLGPDGKPIRPAMESLRALTGKCGAPPRTWTSTSRPDGSGIRWFRVPAHIRDGWPTEAGPCVELIRRSHRYAVVAPSINPETLKSYYWIRPDGSRADEGEIPRPGDLAELPASWVEELTGVRPDGTRDPQHVRPGSRAEQRERRKGAKEWIESLPGGEPCAKTASIAVDLYAAARREDGNAYDHTRDSVLALLRAGEQEHCGVPGVIEAALPIYVQTVSDKRDARTATAEFQRFTLDGAVQIMGSPSDLRGCDCEGGRRVRVETVEPDEADAFPEPEWPDPPKDAVYMGLAGEIVDQLEPYTEADPIALLVNLLVMFGNAVNRTPYYPVGPTRHYMNEFALLVGATSRGRKGTADDLTRAVLGRVDGEWLETRYLPALTSGEGLIHHVRDARYEERPIKEKGKVTGYETVRVDEGVQDKRLMVIAAEFARILRVSKQDTNIVSTILREAWDKGLLVNPNKNSPERATSAHVSILGHITITELLREFDSTDLANGFANRFLFCCVRRSKELPEPVPVPDVVCEQFAKPLREALAKARGFGAVRMSEPARRLWCEKYSELTRDHPGMIGAVLARGEAHVVRLRQLYALLGASREIQQSHLEAALAFWDYSERSTRFIFGDRQGDPVADRILDELRRRHPGGLTETEISVELFGRNVAAERLRAARSALARAGLIRSERTSSEGRPVTKWFAVDVTKKTN